LITFSVLLITILAFLGVFGYKKYLENQIGAFSQSLDDIKSEIEPNFITDVANFADRIEVGERILLNHIVVSSIFKLLEESTLNKVSFSNFSFSVEGQTQGGDGGSNKILMSGVAGSFLGLAKQMDIFKNVSFIKNAEFSSFNLLSDGGVNFSVQLAIDPLVLKPKY